MGFKRDGSAVLSFTPEFRAKTETLSRPVPRDFTIPALSSLTDDKDELLLCPVRALKLYLKITRFQGRSNKLFVSPWDFTCPLSKNGITHFLKQVISDAYADIPPELIRITKINPHEIMAETTSLRFKYNMDQVALLKSAYWRSNSVFCSRYLRDSASTYLDGLALGPLIVAQGVIQHID